VKGLLEHVERSLRERKLLRRGARILVAVSGGVDSMVLLHLLKDLAVQCDWTLCVAHFNHQLRGRASAADERLVRRAATDSKLSFAAGRGDVKRLVQQRGLSVEMAARELRHKFLAQTARRLRCPVIAVAHHADDQVELFFLRLLRGAGGEGLAGMKWTSVSSASRQVRIIRPLLDVGKAELEEFARENRISFREDASNASREVLRNRLRHELLPSLREHFQPALERTVLRVMDVVGADAEAVVFAARAWLAKIPREQAFEELPVGVQRQAVQLQLQRHKISADFDLIETLRRQPGKLITIRPRLSVMREASGRMVLTTATPLHFKKGEVRVNLVRQSPPVFFSGLEVNWDFAEGGGFGWSNKSSSVELFDASKIGRKIVLRHWRAGDRFQPIGMKLPVKLQDWFTNQKIPAARRRELVVAATERGEIFWVEGLRIGEKFKLDNDTCKRLRWSWCRGKSCIAGLPAPC